MPTYKCTKIVNLGESLFSTGNYRMHVEYTDPTTVPPTPGSVDFDIPFAKAAVISEVTTYCDTQLGLLGGNTMDWSL